ncbi:MAG: FAD-dependent monooxygenase [Trueperaceae bacterium]|nr:FAD-dependent monooxygenase [Trueperaceae bacterium]
MSAKPAEVIVVGAGPVGLFLGCRLAQLGVRVKVLERRLERSGSSKAIGIHPPSLEYLDRIGVAKAMTSQGIKIKRGKAFTSKRRLGEVDFELCPKPFSYILALPQFITEEVLEKRLKELAPCALEQGVSVCGLEQTATEVLLSCEKEGQLETFSASFVVACDGKDSWLRKQLGIEFVGRSYPDSYVMGDFKDSTDLAHDAGIFLTKEGLIESFPLPCNMRRWVAKTDTYLSKPDLSDLIKPVQDRLGIVLDAESNKMLSSFKVQRYLAERFTEARVLLAGDAAHVLSPIGGQGMNLGWLDAWEAAAVLQSALHAQDFAPLFATYSRKRKKAARKATRRAEMNMYLGRKMTFVGLKYALVSLLLRRPFKTILARVFTMRWL